VAAHPRIVTDSPPTTAAAVSKFQLLRGDLLVTADGATRPNARQVLDAFLMQLETLDVNSQSTR
jgi:hypothetical protein